MAGKSKVGGGVDPMHLSNAAHPFTAGPFRGSVKYAKQVGGLTVSPGGKNNYASANSSMKRKG